jgi:hypothetical protein
MLGEYCGGYTFHCDVDKNNNYRLIFESDLGKEWMVFFIFIHMLNLKITKRVHINKQFIVDSVLVMELINPSTS